MIAVDIDRGARMTPEKSIYSTIIRTVRMPLIALAIFLFPGLVIPAFGNGQVTEELGFIEVEDVFAAAKHLQSVKEAPSSITIVTDEDIRRYGHRNLTDVVNNVRSFYTYSDRNYDYIGVRGFARLGDYGNRVLQLIDGHTNNDNIYGSFNLGQTFGVDMDLIKKIEFIRGPGSALYGSNALFGTVNVITKTGKDVGGLFAKAEGGSYNTGGGTVIFGKEYGTNFDLLISASFLNSGGQDLHYPEFGNPSVSDGWVRDADGERARKFLLKATFHEVTFLGNLAWREKNVPTAGFGTIFNDNRLRSLDERAFAELQWNHPFDADKRLKTRIYFDRYRFEGTYPYDYPPVTMNKDEVLGQWIGGEAAYDQRIASHHVLIGGETVYYLDARQKNYDEAPRLVYLDDSRSYGNWSLFGQDEWDMTPWLRFTGGVRYDRYNTFGEHLSPRAGFIINPSAGATIKLLYGQAFRSPNVYELYYRSSTGTSEYRDNPALKPETIDTYEIVLDRELTSIVKLTASGFHYAVKDLITQQVNADGSLQFFNTTKVKSDGAEIGLEISWPGVLKGHASYTYQDTRDDLTGQRLTNSPLHLLKAGVRVPLYQEMIFLGAQGRYMGARLDRDGGDVGDATVMDLNLSAENKGFSVSAGVYNLFDTIYVDPVSADHLQKTIHQNGRNFWLKAGYTF